jgi:hypothetical protein
MQTKDFTISFLVDQSPIEVFNTVLDIRKWWSGYYAEEITGDTGKLNDEFSFRAGGGMHFSKHKLVELVPGKKITWLTTDSALSFTANSNEWTGTKLVFDISQKGSKTQLRFTHQGLTAQAECFEACAPTWEKYLQHKLLPLINNKVIV